MTEQVSVDEIALLREECKPLGRTILERFLEDYKQLKRLDENVQRQIKIANRMHEWASKHGFEVAFYDEQVEFLEGLYK
jgi:hypothetical protein